jgi:hypothetical protein
MHGFDNHLNHVDSGHDLKQYALKRGDLLRIAGGTESVANLFKGAEDDRRAEQPADLQIPRPSG